jgi:hypothetical protein
MSGERGRLTLKSPHNARCGKANPRIPALTPHGHSSALIRSTPLALMDRQPTCRRVNSLLRWASADIGTHLVNRQRASAVGLAQMARSAVAAHVSGI